MDLFNYFKEQLDIYLPREEVKLAVAVSGGADSMALAILLKRSKINFIALTVDHGLRKESAQEAVQVGKWLRELKIDHVILQWQGSKPSSNIQEEARNARYQIMANYCLSNKINYLLVAHHLNDQAETVLLRLSRGSGIDGLAGMSVIKDLYGIKIFRPFLDIPKKTLINFLKEENINWIEDPSNKNEKFKRVKLRNMLEQFEDEDILIKRLSQTAKHMIRARSYIEQQVELSLKDLIIKEQDIIKLNMQIFAKTHPEIALRVLLKIIKIIAKDAYKPRFVKLERLYDDLLASSYKGATLYGCIFGKKDKDGNISIKKEF